MGRRTDLCESCKKLLHCEKKDGYHYKCSLDEDTEFVHVNSYHEQEIPQDCPESDKHDLDFLKM